MRRNIQSLDSALYTTLGAYQTEVSGFRPVSSSLAGKRLFLSLDTRYTGNGIAAVDDLTLVQVVAENAITIGDEAFRD